MNEYFANAEKRISSLQDELYVVKLQRDAYKYELEQLQKPCGKEHIVHLVIYTRDNGEGLDTEVCIGVFSCKVKALQAIADVCERNNVHSNMFEVREFDVGHVTQPGSKVYVTHLSEEAHCEVSTRIMSVKIERTSQSIDGDEYDVEYVVDRYNSVYPLGF